MIRIVLLIVFVVNQLSAQTFPKFSNDTLYTSCGYKIFKGQVLKFGSGSGENGRFRFVKIRGNDKPSKLNHKFIRVDKVSDFYISGLNNFYIKIKGTVLINDTTKRHVRFKMVFEKAMISFQGAEPELLLPAEYSGKNSYFDDLEKLYSLYRNGALSKEEYEIEKKKILNR